MTKTLDIRVRRTVSGETVRAVPDGVFNDYLLEGLQQGSAWQHLAALARFRRRKRRKSTAGHKRRASGPSARPIRIPMSKETEAVWRQKVDQIKRLRSRDVRLKSSQIRKNLSTVALARAASISYDIPIDQLISSGTLSPLVLELISRRAPSSQAGATIVEPPDENKPDRSPGLIVEATVMTPEEAGDLIRERHPSPEGGRILGYEEANRRLDAIIDRTQRRLAELKQ